MRAAFAGAMGPLMISLIRHTPVEEHTILYQDVMSVQRKATLLIGVAECIQKCGAKSMRLMQVRWAHSWIRFQRTRCPSS